MFFKNNRGLKAENKVLTASNERLTVQRNEAQAGSVALIDKITRLEKDINQILENASKITTERDKLKDMVREQTGADLLINALKAVRIIKDDEKTDYFARSENLSMLQRQAASMNTNIQRLGVLGGVFGRS